MYLSHQNIPQLFHADVRFLLIINTNAGRYHLNILGSYNPDSHEFIHLM